MQTTSHFSQLLPSGILIFSCILSIIYGYALSINNIVVVSLIGHGYAFDDVSRLPWKLNQPFSIY